MENVEKHSDTLQNCGHHSTHLDIEFQRKHLNVYAHEIYKLNLFIWLLLLQYIVEIVLLFHVQYLVNHGSGTIKENLACGPELSQYLKAYIILN